MKIKDIIYIIITVLILGLGVSTKLLYNQNKKQQLEIEQAITNIKAYELENSNLKDKSAEFQLTIDQLNHSSDSITQILNKTREELKIKDKEIQKLSYIQSTTYKIDSIIVLDTIFREGIKIDTTIKDSFSKLHLQMEYPGDIVVDYSFNNQCVIATTAKKQTVDPPKKFFIARWFQKKYIVTETIVEELNPYAEIKEFRTINITE